MKRGAKLLVGLGTTLLCGASVLATAGSSTLGAQGAGAASGRSGVFIPAPLPAARSHAITKATSGVTQVGSENWSGYAQNAANGTYTDVVDTWVVPTVTAGVSGKQYSADWVGVGGFSEGTLVQAGTEADNVKGKPKYDAWTEILPASERVITGLAVHPGDTITTTVREISAGKWNMTVADLTTGKSGGRTVKYKSSGASAEAIHERPEVGGTLATLTKTNNVTFVPGDFSSTAPGSTPVLTPLLEAASQATVNQIFMLNNAGTTSIASPSVPSTSLDGFAVQDGAASPAPPAG
jgi:Peptidase A4 family